MAGSAGDTWFWNDWAGEPTLKISSLAAQAVWMRMLCVMAEAEPRGYLVRSDAKGKTHPLSMEQLSRIAGASVDEVTRAVDELGQNGVYSTDRRGWIYCRRMVRQERKKQASSEGGKRGGRSTHHRRTGIFSAVDNRGGSGVDNSPPTKLATDSRATKTGDNPDLTPQATNGTKSVISTTQGATQHPMARAHSIPISVYEESSSTEKTAATKKNSFHAKGVGGKNGGSVTLKDPAERLARFQKWLADGLGRDGWSIVAAAADPSSPEHRRAKAICREYAITNGKGWPQQWPGGG